MKKVLTLSVVLLSVMAMGFVALAGGRGTMALKAGDEVFVCNCGEACPCLTMSRNAGKCTCGKEMVKAKVASAEDGKATVKVEGWEKARVFMTVGKFTCACPPECRCDTISQNAGKCTCGKEMKKVEM